MKLTFENLGTNTYLVYEVNETDELDTMSLGMLTNNHIPGFSPASFMQVDTTKYIKYNVSAKVSVNQLFAGPVNKKRLLGVFTGVVDAMLSAEEYMLETQSVLLDKDYIFADVSTCETELICLPILNVAQQNQDLAMFFKNILFTTQFDQTENCDHVAQLINYLNGNISLSLSDFKTLLHTLSGNATTPAVQQKPQPTVQPAQTTQPAQGTQPLQSVQPVQPVQSVQPVQPVQPAKVAPAVAPVKTAQAVPPVKAVPTPAVAATPAQPASGEKPMSLFYLMQHYNKENAEIYKRQQEAAKAGKAAPQQKAVPPMPGVNVPGQKAAPVAPVNIPGQKAAPVAPVNIPGQKAAPVAGVNIPGQTAAVKPVQPVQPVPQPVQPAPQPVQPAPQPVIQPMGGYQTQVPNGGRPVNFGETTVLGQQMGETTVLNGGAVAQPKQEPYLIRAKNNEKIPLNKPVFRIGKEKSYVDYFIGDNTAISRSHANIINHNGEYFVVDTNSTNHTYVNGGMIHSNEEVKISHGTKIRLANEDFEFNLY